MIVSVVGAQRRLVENKLLQQVNFSAGKTFTTFNFLDNDGKKSDQLSYTSGNTYALSLGLVFGRRHVFRPELLFSEAGAKSEFLDAPINWKLTYLGVGTGYLFKVINKDNFSLSPGIIVGYDYLMKGEQTVGTERYNLVESKILKNWDLNGGVLLNSSFKLTRTMCLNFEYRFNVGFNQIEKKDEGEHTRNLGHKAILGLSFNL